MATIKQMQTSLLFAFLFLISTCSKGQPNDELVGVWKPNSKIESPYALKIPSSIELIEIKRVGKKEISYFVFFDDHAAVSFKRIGNALIHVFKKDTLTIHFDPSYKTLKIDRKNVVGIPDDPTFFKATSYSSNLLSSKSKKYFFDFDLHMHQSGVPENAVPKTDWMLFRINPSIILANKIESLKIPVYKSFKDTMNSKLIYLTIFKFNVSGDVMKINRIYEPEKTEASWNFFYRNDNEQSLEKILLNSNLRNDYLITFNYDTDNWLVDEIGQKVVTSRLEWVINKSNFPAKLWINHFYEEFIEFFYDDSNNLTLAIYKMGKSTITYYFYYSDFGILKKVNIVEGT